MSITVCPKCHIKLSFQEQEEGKCYGCGFKNIDYYKKEGDCAQW